MRISKPAVLIAAVLALATAGCGGDAKPKSKSKPKHETLTVDTGRPGGTTPKDDVKDPKSSGEPAGGGAAPVVETPRSAMRRLTSNDADDRARGVAVLVNAEYDPEIGAEVVTGLVRRLADSKKPIRDSAMAALAKWARTDDVPVVAGVLGRQENDIRHRGIEVLGKIGGPDAAIAVAERLDNAFDRELATRTLKSMGSDAEPAVVPFAESRDKYVRLAVVDVLDQVGTAKGCGEELLLLIEDPEPEVATAALRALDKVESR